MQKIDDILNIQSQGEFDAAALELFHLQAHRCGPYREYLSLIGVAPGDITRAEDIPYMPIELFKTHRVYCGDGEPEVVFTSSSTGGMGSSHHFMARRSDYEKTFTRTFGMFYGAPADVAIYALLPGYLEREGSSLVYMIDALIRSGRGGGFYLDQYDRLLADMEADRGAKILFGVSYALLDLAEKYAPRLTGTVIMETGGMKGRREEMSKQEFHAFLCRQFGVDRIHSEYGMAELSSQAYSAGGNIFKAPPWMRVTARDLNDPFDRLAPGRTGGLNIADLANIGSCAFIQTRDVGTVNADGTFSVLGRADRSEIRGCNLLVQ